MIVENFWLVSISYYLISIVIIVIVLSLLNRHEKLKLKKEIENLEKEKNLVISSAILTELNKVKALANNEELKDKYKKWKKQFDDIKNKEIAAISSDINEIDLLYLDNNYKDLRKVIFDVELKINSLKTKTEFLLDEIKEVTLSEERNRETITKLKAEYRDILHTYQDDLDSYSIIKKPLELQFENINKLFSSFEDLMENNEYLEVSKIVKAIDDIVQNLKVIIDETKPIVSLGKKLIPKKIDEIMYLERSMINDGFNLEYLNIDYNKEEAEKKIIDIFRRLNVLNVQDSLFELKIMYDYFVSLFSDFEKEKVSRKYFEEYSKNIILKTVKLEKINNKLLKKIDDIKYSYDLSEDEVAVIFEIKDELSDIRETCDRLRDIKRSKILPYTKLAKEIEYLNIRLIKTEEKLNVALRTLGNLKNDEKRAREQLNEIKTILFSAKEKVRTFKLPVVPKNYYVELSEANNAVETLMYELDKRPISISALNMRVDTARDLTLKVYNTINETVKTAKMAEMAIIYGNRFRTINKEIHVGLVKAESMFNRGLFKNSLEMAINTINIVEPGIHNKLMGEYKL